MGSTASAPSYGDHPLAEADSAHNEAGAGPDQVGHGQDQPGGCLTSSPLASKAQGAGGVSRP